MSKAKFNGMEVIISKGLINSNISHYEFVLINNGLKEYDNIKEETKKNKDFKTFSKSLVYL